jgi:tRNA(Arg) A34 adenosine deaminase TadA
LHEVKPNFIFDTAVKLAKTSDYKRFRMGAIIARKRKIISLGTNAKKSHTLQSKYTCRPFLHHWRHAEVHAITLAGKTDLNDCDIYVARILADNTIGTSRPCEGCLKALKAFGIRGMYFIEDGKYYYDGLKS